MNFEVGLFENAWFFWVVCAAILALGMVTLVAAKKRRWISRLLEEPGTLPRDSVPDHRSKPSRSCA